MIRGGGQALKQLLEALYSMQKDCGFDSRCFHWNFSLTYPFRPHYYVTRGDRGSTVIKVLCYKSEGR